MVALSGENLLKTLYTALEGAFYYLYCPKGSEKNGARTEPAAPTSKEGLHSEWLAALLSELLIHLYTLAEDPHAPGCSHSTTRCCNVQLSLIGQV